MRNRSIIQLFVLLFVFQAAALYGGARISQEGVQVFSDGTNVIVKWNTESEENLSHFVIQRRTYNGDFMDIAIVEPDPSQTYEYVDESAYKTSEQIYVYQIKIVDNDGTVTYIGSFPVRHNVSSVKRTWGSIKALFR